jgi:glucosyl-3-phosphoglycerate synthase
MDTADQHGLDALAQVDLGARAHRHQANHDLALMAAELLVVAERRRPAAQRLPAREVLRQFVRAEDGGVSPRLRPVPAQERPPAASVSWHGERP